MLKTFLKASKKKKEGQLILNKLSPTDHLIVLDENGKEFSSIGFSEFLQKKMNSVLKQLFCYWWALWIFRGSIPKSAGKSFFVSNDVFSSNDTFIYY